MINSLAIKCVLAGAGAVVFAAGCTTVERGPEPQYVMMKKAPKKGDPDYDPDQMVCKFKPATGSRLGRIKDCRTARVWERSGTAAARALNEYGNKQIDQGN